MKNFISSYNSEVKFFLFHFLVNNSKLKNKLHFELNR